MIRVTTNGLVFHKTNMALATQSSRYAGSQYFFLGQCLPIFLHFFTDQLTDQPMKGDIEAPIPELHNLSCKIQSNGHIKVDFVK